MRQVAAGEIGGLETLYDRYHGMAYALALRITTETGLAEDVVQDSFLGVWRNAGRYAEAKGSVRGWLLAIVRHRAIDAMRRQRASVALGEEAEEVLPAALTLPDIWPEIAGRLDAEQVRRALTVLPPAQREVIELAYFDGLTQREIAGRTRAPLGTVKSRMRLGLVALREQLVDQKGGASRTAVPSSNGKKGPA
ncbi:MAG: sigma-70 family RNA polymerase sigma factor [Candidatus Limnocylindrales bacterium]|jgi:RNA polymerase sigma factor (sigma-70 family)